MRFYGYFASAYGTIWFVLMLAALVTQSHINTGPFGMFGFPVVAFVYARNPECRREQFGFGNGVPERAYPMARSRAYQPKVTMRQANYRERPLRLSVTEFDSAREVYNVFYV